tara:strand:+ start:8241 stop:9362 length:1122 start_codon:yes stop_codon:yes gene_type:complete
LTKLFKIFEFLKTVKISFKIPEKNFFLYYDYLERLNLNFLKNENVEKINFRNEINFLIAILSLFTVFFWSGKFKFAYCYSYIKFVSPKITYTFTDNDTLFYKLKFFFPNCKFFSFQNGTRTISQDIFAINKNEDLACDMVFTHNDHISKEYKKIINTKTMTFGSYLNNINPKIYSKKNNIIFISQFSEKKNFNFVNYKGKKISWDDYYYPEKVIMSILDEFCFKNKISLNICARFNSNKYEKFFYKENVLKANMKFMDKLDYYNSYELIDQSKMVIFIDSTLGYESISRQNKTVALSVRSKLLNDHSFDFAWPIDIKKKGSFWTNDLDKKEILKLINENYFKNDEQWIECNKDIIKKVMHLEKSVSKINSLFL